VQRITALIPSKSSNSAFRIDGVFLPNITDPSIPIYFCEVQFQDDQNFYGRFFAEIFLYLVKLLLTMIGVGWSFIPIVG
jgi:predicted transposase YdaD